MYPTKPPHCNEDFLKALAPTLASLENSSSAFGGLSTTSGVDGVYNEPLAVLFANFSQANATAAGCYESLSEQQRTDFLQYERFVGGYCNCVVGCIGLIGNLLSVLVLSQKEMQKNNCFNKLLIALVTSDSLHILFGVLEAFRNAFPMLYPQVLRVSFPWFHYPFYRITLVVSIYMMVAIAIERYLAVCFPHDYQTMSSQRNRVLYYILPAVSLGVLFNITRFWETKIEERVLFDDNCTEKTVQEIVPTQLRLDHIYIITYVNWIWTVSTGIVPFVALLLLNGTIFRGLKKVQRNLNRHQRLANASEARDRGNGVAAHSTAAAKEARDVVEAETVLRNVMVISLQDRNQVTTTVSSPTSRSINPALPSGNNYANSPITEDTEHVPMTARNTTVVLDDDAAVANTTVVVTGVDKQQQQELPKTETPPTPSSKHQLHPNRKVSMTSSQQQTSFTSRLRKHNSSFQRARTAAQRRLLSAAQSREANMAVILVCSVTMFLICHLPRLFIVVFEAMTVSHTMSCRAQNMLAFPVWFLYVPPMVRFLQVLNASVNFPIYYIMGTAFRNAMHSAMCPSKNPHFSHA